MTEANGVGDTNLTRREWLTRGAGAIAATGAAVAGGYLLYDPKGDAGLPRPSESGHRLRNYFEDVDFPDSRGHTPAAWAEPVPGQESQSREAQE